MLPDDDKRYDIETCRSSESVLKKWFKINDIQLVHLLVVWWLVNHKTHFILGAKSYMFRHQCAILRDLNNNKGSWVKHVLQVLVARVTLTVLCCFLSPSGWHLGAETCRTWHLIWIVFHNLFYFILSGGFCWLKYRINQMHAINSTRLSKVTSPKWSIPQPLRSPLSLLI